MQVKCGLRFVLRFVKVMQLVQYTSECIGMEGGKTGELFALLWVQGHRVVERGEG
jgi:hypothetical protein